MSNDETVYAVQVTAPAGGGGVETCVGINATIDAVRRWLPGAQEMKVFPVPESERIVHENPELRESLERGMAQAAAGDVGERGSFEQYVDDDESPAGGAGDE